MTVITLTTDFGTSSAITGQMHGVLLSIAPEARLVDLTHDIPRGDCLAAQVILDNTAPYFPDGTIHLVMVSDPDTERESSRPIAAQLGPQLFVGPDTGLITPLLERAETNRWTVEVVYTNRQEYWRSDNPGEEPEWPVFASLAAHLAAGVPITELGERINDPQRSSIPAPEMVGEGWRGQVIQIDHFGNLSANLKGFHLEGMGKVQVRVGGFAIDGLSRTFGDGQPGDLIAMIDSSNRLSICIVNGSAAHRLGVHAGDIVEVQPLRKS